MKLKEVYKNLLSEIGDSSSIPSGASFKMDMYEGKVTFEYIGDKYQIDIRFASNEKSTGTGNRIAIIVDFFANKDKDASMTNKGQALKVMSFVVGCLQEWLRRYTKKFGEVELVYIKFMPKSEESDVADADGVNKRDKLYRAYIDRFASKNGSSVSYTTSSGIVSKFNPNIIIK